MAFSNGFILFPGKQGELRQFAPPLKEGGTGPGVMEFVRYKSDAWGQTVLQGASWDLIWVFVVAAVVFIVFHAIYTHRKLRRQQGDD